MKNRYGEALGTKSGGFSVVGWLLLTPIAIIVLIIFVVSVFEGRKAYWDFRVKEMCEKDGKIQVYEHVAIPERYLDKDRNIKIPPASSDLSRKPFAWEAKPSDLFFTR